MAESAYHRHAADLEVAAAKRPLVLVLSPFVAFPGITHAGGHLLTWYLTRLAVDFEVHLFTPDCLLEIALMPQDLPWQTHVLRSAHGTVGRAVELVAKAIRGPSLSVRAEWDLTRAEGFRSLARQAVYVDAQWLEAASAVRRCLPRKARAQTTLVLHDVVSQRLERVARNERNPLKRAWVRYRKRRALHQESAAARFFDRVLVLSSKDGDLLLRRNPGANVAVLNLPLGRTGGAATEAQVPARQNIVLFTGAMARPENDEGARWFIDSIWPSVVTRCPEAEFVVAGAAPTERLRRAAEAAPNVYLTGYVEDLHAWYHRASVFVAPLLNGAGVKFKVVDAMLAGLPVVSTPIGAEGIGGPEIYERVTSDPVEFAVSVVRLLRDETHRQAVARRSREYAHHHFSEERFCDQMRGLYVAS